jgi:hypothetical protein
MCGFALRGPYSHSKLYPTLKRPLAQQYKGRNEDLENPLALQNLKEKKEDLKGNLLLKLKRENEELGKKKGLRCRKLGREDLT